MQAGPSGEQREGRGTRRERRIDRRIGVLVRILFLAMLPFIRFDIRGGARARTATNLIIVGNHRSMLDFLVGLHTARLFGRYPRVLLAQQYARGRWMGPIMRWIGAIPVPSGDDRGDALDDGITALLRGLSTVVMPEGRLHRDTRRPALAGRRTHRGLPPGRRLRGTGAGRGRARRRPGVAS